MDSIAAQAIPILAEPPQLKAQERSNTAWSYSTLPVSHAPLLAAIASAAIRSIEETGCRHMANTAWSLAVLHYRDDPLMTAIASSAIPRLSELSPLSLASTAWSWAQCSCPDEPLLHALSAALLRMLASSEGRLDDGIIGMAIAALSRSTETADFWALMACSRGASFLSRSPMFTSCELRGPADGELALLRGLACGDLRAAALNALALRLGEQGRLAEVNGVPRAVRPVSAVGTAASGGPPAPAGADARTTKPVRS
mmetsp:Transcript_15312/g.43798  ORF Transcript_15312/g.43798 Transcript_15312/m.43798 type:complete len:256 (-) Transcript_15312:14-781(-)